MKKEKSAPIVLCPMLREVKLKALVGGKLTSKHSEAQSIEHNSSVTKSGGMKTRLGRLRRRAKRREGRT